MKKIVLFASGSGTNVENIVEYFKKKKQNISFFVFSNKPDAYVLERAKKLEISSFVFSKSESTDGTLLDRIEHINPDLIVLAGYLWKFPESIIRLYPNKIINVHPALLPKYGGKGMYGMHVHKAVADNKETETGISIHYVNEHYDEGTIIFQTKTTISPNDTANDIAHKVHQLEYKYFPKIIDQIINEKDVIV